MTKKEPYISYEFSNHPNNENSKNGVSIYTPVQDNTKTYKNVPDMKNNLNCQENPETINKAKEEKCNTGSQNQKKDDSQFSRNYSFQKLAQDQIMKQRGGSSEIRNPNRMYNSVDHTRSASNQNQSAIEICDNPQPNYEQQITNTPRNKEDLLKYYSSQPKITNINCRSQNDHHRTRILKTNGSQLSKYQKNINKCSANQYTPNFICKTERSENPRYMRDTHIKMKNIIAEQNTIFERETSANKGKKYTRHNWIKHESYKDKLNPHYDAVKARVIDNKSQWNVDKSQVLADMKYNEKYIMDNTQLMKRVFELKKTTDLNKKFPKFVSYDGSIRRPQKNDLHNKVTNGGYSRNEWGRPFFT